VVKYIHLPAGAPICCCGPPPPTIGSCADLPDELTLHYDLWSKQPNSYTLIEKLSSHQITLEDTGLTNPRRWRFTGEVECGQSRADDPDNPCTWLRFTLNCRAEELPWDRDYFDAAAALYCDENFTLLATSFLYNEPLPDGSDPSTSFADLFDLTADPWELTFQQRLLGRWQHFEGDCAIIPIRITL